MIRKMLGVASAVIWLGAGALCADVKETLGQYEKLSSGFVGNKSDFIKVSHERRLTTSFRLNPSPNGDAVNAIVSIEPQQLQSITNRGGWVEVRLYVGPRGQERRLENRTYELRQNKQSFTLPYRDVCQNPGPVSVRVWTTVKGTDRSYSDGEAREDFICSSGRRSDRPNNPRQGAILRSRVNFHIEQGLVRAHINIDPPQFALVRSLGGHVEVRLYAGDQRGQERRLESRTYGMASSQAEYTLPPSEVCDRSSFLGYNRYLKVWLSARDFGGKPLAGFRSAEGARIQVTCEGFIWRGWELLEEILED